jgi:hypothetical protein
MRFPIRILSLLLLPAVFALLPACGPSEDSFDAAFAESFCALQFECYDAALLATLGWSDEAACVAEVSQPDTAGGGEYRAKDGKACLDALETVTCEDLKANTFPAVCAEVR